MLKTQPFLSDKYEIGYLVVNGKHLVKDFISGLPKKDRIRITSLLKFAASQGPPNNTQKFKKLYSIKEIDVYEFKPKPYRILCTFDGEKKIILCHVFKKCKRPQAEREISKAVRLFKQYFEGRKNEDE